MIFKTIIVVLLLIVLFSLGQALFFLIKDEGKSDRMLKALTWRIGLSVFILIGLYVQYELSFDKYHENADRIYRVVRDGKTLTPAPLAPARISGITPCSWGL